MTRKKGPPSVMRGYKPDVVRICWIAETTEGTFHSGVTWGGLPSLTQRRGKELKHLKIVDMRFNKVYEVLDYGIFLAEWGENYWNADWAMVKCKGLRKF